MPKSHKKKSHRSWIVLALLILMGGGGWWGWQYYAETGKSAVAAPPPPVRVTVASVVRRDVPQDIKLVGAVYAYETVSIKSRTDSQIVNVRFRDGDLVHEGDVLLELDARSLLAQRAQLAANLERDQVQLKNAKSQYERSQQLVNQGYVTKEKSDMDKTAYDAQAANVVATKAALDSLDVQLSYMVIKAPITGRAGMITVTAGNNVKANDTQPIVTINKIDPVRVQFAVPQRYFDRLKAATAAGEVPVQAARAEMQGSLAGALDYIDNAIDQSNGTFAARAKFANPDEKLWPGMFVDVTLTPAVTKDALVIPMTAVQGDRGNNFVFVVDVATRKAAKRMIKTLPQADNSAIVTEGLSEGEQVVIDGLLRVTEGAQLEIVSPKTDKQTP